MPQAYGIKSISQFYVFLILHPLSCYSRRFSFGTCLWKHFCCQGMAHTSSAPFHLSQNWLKRGLGKHGAFQKGSLQKAARKLCSKDLGSLGRTSVCRERWAAVRHGTVIGTLSFCTDHPYPQLEPSWYSFQVGLYQMQSISITQRGYLFLTPNRKKKLYRSIDYIH